VEDKVEYFKELLLQEDREEVEEEFLHHQCQVEQEIHHQYRHLKEIQGHQEQDLTETVQEAVAVEQEHQEILLIIEQRDQADLVLELK
jgi:hypothetical protein